VIGVVTRTDLLRALHGARYAEGYRPWGTAQAEQLLSERLPARIQKLLAEIGEAATGQGVEAFVVGGFVRDLILGVENLDVDVLVDRDAALLAGELARGLDGKIKGHHQFATATITLADGQKIDISTARSEVYEQLGALPEVEPTSIQSDLYRRDFSINAMAIQINPERFGRLLDPYGGRRDLERRVIRVLHNLSFLEDPTRIFRAARFEGRFGFHMDRHTEELARGAVEGGALGSISGERIRRELYLQFAEPNPLGGLRRIAALGVLDWLCPGLTLDTALLERVSGSLDGIARRAAERIDRRVVYLAALVAPIPPERAEPLLRRNLRIPDPKVDVIMMTLCRAEAVLDRLATPELRQSEIYAALDGLPLETLAFLHARSRDPIVEARLSLYLTRLRHVTTAIKGADLIAMGHRPGPRFGAALRAVLEARLDEVIHTREEELALAVAILEGRSKRDDDSL
jgi:tRNA nucleotidyltransferase (CCA-adding enzyme)